MANIFSDKHIISDLIEHYLYNKIKLSNAECQSYKRMMGTFAGEPDIYCFSEIRTTVVSYRFSMIFPPSH